MLKEKKKHSYPGAKLLLFELNKIENKSERIYFDFWMNFEIDTPKLFAPML